MESNLRGLTALVAGATYGIGEAPGEVDQIPRSGQGQDAADEVGRCAGASGQPLAPVDHMPPPP